MTHITSFLLRICYVKALETEMRHVFLPSHSLQYGGDLPEHYLNLK